MSDSVPATDAQGAVLAQFPGAVARPSADHPAITVPAAEVLAVLRFLKESHGFDFLCDVTAVDWSANVSPRFTVVWHLFSTTSLNYVRVASDCANDLEPEMASATGLWPAADWHERETWDLMGIRFAGHPDLRRILMWDGYPYHPLRKDFPLGGLPCDLPDAEIAGVVTEKVITAPMAGGPFVASTGEMCMADAEPRAKDESWNERRPKPNA